MEQPRLIDSDTTIANNAAAIIPQANYFFMLDVSDSLSNRNCHITRIFHKSHTPHAIFVSTRNLAQSAEIVNMPRLRTQSAGGGFVRRAQDRMPGMISLMKTNLYAITAQIYKISGLTHRKDHGFRSSHRSELNNLIAMEKPTIANDS